ncbi:MAG TPA: adenylosuccinate synthetase [Thermoanaerobaculia bacterium]|jgi:adenylosuccinate synthase
MGKCYVVVGGQYGSEGKGKVVALLARYGAPFVVRCGGPNSGHTTNVNGREVIVRQLPAGVANPDSMLLVGAGCVVDEDLLLAEIEALGVTASRVIVDPRAVLIEDSDRIAEAPNVFAIGSTASGTGAALVRRISRSNNVRLASGSTRLRARVRVEPVAQIVHEALHGTNDVIIEGTQGFGLSLLHGETYPFVTARDTTASAFCSEVGISPRHVTDVLLVVRTYPIRVGGNSGPFPNEVTWETVRAESRAPEVVPEYTSVTHRLRRVARFDIDLVKKACRYNAPTRLAVMGIDRLDHINEGAESAVQLSRIARNFVENLEKQTKVKVGFVGTGFRTYDAVDLDDPERKICDSQDIHAQAPVGVARLL